ncbi:hypothetical protein O6H91_01G131300 [Diphasiastrum complanatum]|uniref:Uncharacterized protein n=1 Tax=Diphasiastrum complanatum TaxID=34168 RepID=A0ACC2EW13_DIPCM|nr:hypothetical protein O6H91_01G131300 [Diphasiastrum complanatum]
MAAAASSSTYSCSSSSFGSWNRCGDAAFGLGLCLSSGGGGGCRYHFHVAKKKLSFYGSGDRRALLRRLPAQSRRPGKSRRVVSKSNSPLDFPNTGTRKLWKLPGTLEMGRDNQSQLKDNNVVFVAGATGKVGSRTVRELLKLGFTVRAGVRNIEKAKSFFQEAPQLSPGRNSFENFSPAKLFKFLSSAKEGQLEILECDLEIADEIELALGNAGVVICCIGASEKEVLDVTGPYRIDYQATKNLIVAATKAQVNHFVLLTSLGTTKFGWPAAALNLFWGVLIWKAKAEKALRESGLSYTIVRPGGMERPTDAYKETHNLRLVVADSLTGGQVSNLQVAELLACIAKNLQLGENKILEVVAETTAPLRPIEEMLAEIPEQPRDELMTKEQNGVSKRGAPNIDNKQQAIQKRQVEERMEKELRLKFKSELLALKEEESKAAREKLILQNKRVKVLEQAETASMAASQAKALANALMAAANEGRILTEQEKQKILKSVRAEALSRKKTETQPTDEPLPLPSLVRNARVSKQPSQSQPTSEASPLPSQELAVQEAQSISQKQSGKSAESDLAMVESLTTNADSLDTKLDTELSKSQTADTSLQPAQSKYNGKFQLDTETSKQPSTIPREQVTKDSVSRKEEAIIQNATKVDEVEKIEQVSEPEEDFQPTAQTVPSGKSFRWFWQEESEPETPSPNGAAADTTSEAQTTTNPLPSISPLSPYSRYPDLKPPTSPTPRPSAFQPSSLKTDVTLLEEVQEELKKDNDIEVDRQAVAMLVATRERIALEKAKASLSLYWPWQPHSEPIAEETETGSTSPKFVTPPAQVSQDSAPVQRKQRPLSPYTMYPDLKPPSSPTPSSPTLSKSPLNIVNGVKEEANPKTNGIRIGESKLQKAVEEPEIELNQSKSSSFGVEPLTMTKSDEAEIRRVAEEQAKAAAAREALALQLARAQTSLKWPWERPSVAANSAPFQVPSTTPGTETSHLAASPVIGSPSDTICKTRPLSPYTRYPDLKPPTSPTPTTPKLSKASISQISYPKTTNAMQLNVNDIEIVDQNALERENGALSEQDLQSTSVDDPTPSPRFRWPWEL